jgi:hypothetical protein
LAISAVGCADESLHDDQSEASLAALTGDVRLIDAPSTPPVIMRWTAAQDGRAAQKSLEFAIENTTDQPIDVDVYVTSQVGSRVAKVGPTRVGLKARTSVAQSFGIDRLGMQVVGVSASTLITATYAMADGITRAAALPAAWIEHQAGFGSASVRDGLTEARSNAGLGMASLRSRKAIAARVLDATSGRAAQANIPTDDSMSPTQLVAQPSWLPDPAKLRAMNPAKVEPQTDGVSDAQRPAAAADPSAGAFDKGGNFTVCFKLPYWYVDSNMGEDILTGQTSTTEGSEPARYMVAVLVNSANAIIWSGNLSSIGCTPSVNHPNGSYTGWLTTSIYRPATDVLIDVTTDDTKTFTWGAQAYSISTSGGTKTIAFTGAWSLTDGAIAAANTIFRSTFAYPNGTRTDIFTDQTCPSTPGSGCASATQIWLGNNASGFPYAGFKVVTQHELGHRVQGALVGEPNNDYTIDATQAACRCDHVTSSNNLHCLQGRAMVSAAQVEGWGQYFAATNLNNGGDSNCTFAYYKEFRNDNGTVTAPPMAKSCFSQVKWMANHCAASNRGTEWDWMNHYWRVANKDGYSFTDFKNLYRTACGGGSCTGVQVTWFATAAAAVATFGQNTPKATAWSSQSNNFGGNF